MQTAASTRTAAAVTQSTVYSMLFAISIVHMLNDSMQTVVTAMYPVFKGALNLSYTQIGWIGFALNMTSSVLQPLVGVYSDKRPTPSMLPFGMGLSLVGIAGIALAPNFWLLLASVMFVGFGSAIFHPEGSRVVYFAAGGRRGLAQSIYQVGGNAGQALAPLMTLLIFIPLGQIGAIWATILAAAAILVLLTVVPWYRIQLAERGRPVKKRKQAGSHVELHAGSGSAEVNRRVGLAMFLLVFIVFARSWYAAGIVNYYQFYLRDIYGIRIENAQIPLFLYMAAGVAGTYFGGLWGDKYGRKRMIIFSIVGAIPFALLLPHLPLMWVYPVVVVLGFIVMSGFSVSVVYAQELLPGNVGMASGLIVGLAFGMGAIGGLAIGSAGDVWGMGPVMIACSLLPLLGLLSFLLPKDAPRQ
ncbi:MFS transporter [Paenibacillus sambharensis]|uniref:MFS transporter n=1 Tax=Paenibacillus sambharensis TaxID=1803190 RepID=A0A2W1LA35_9BACL|nr:MFS transporter [Paenibacillus sambharensis]PZD95000.1 MFS transporter [Paenibacillus sambharensis]